MKVDQDSIGVFSQNFVKTKNLESILNDGIRMLGVLVSALPSCVTEQLSSHIYGELFGKRICRLEKFQYNPFYSSDGGSLEYSYLNVRNSLVQQIEQVSSASFKIFFVAKIFC